MIEQNPTKDIEQERQQQETATPPLSYEQNLGTNGEIRKDDGAGESLAQTSQRGASFKALVFDILETLLLTIIIYAVLSTFIGRFTVLSISMEPTLYQGQYLLINKQGHKIWPLQRGDIIVFKYPNNPEKYYIKRLIGLPGEKIELRGGKLYVNGELTPEPWIAGLKWSSSGSWKLDNDQYFVMGDNRNNSSDSRSWGAVGKEYIIGKALFRYWPIPDLGPLKHGPKPTAAPKSVTPFESILTSPLPAGTSP